MAAAARTARGSVSVPTADLAPSSSAAAGREVGKGEVQHAGKESGETGGMLGSSHPIGTLYRCTGPPLQHNQCCRDTHLSQGRLTRSRSQPPTAPGRPAESAAAGTVSSWDAPLQHIHQQPAKAAVGAALRHWLCSITRVPDTSCVASSACWLG